MKRILTSAGSFALVRRVFRTFLKGHASVFMMHRFAQPDRGVIGHDPALLRRALGFLRSEGAPLLSVRQLLHRASEGEDISAAVAFTVDDGYADVFDVAAPIFEEFQCPVTVFLATDFLDGRSWMWWDRVRHLILETGKREAGIRLEEGPTKLELGTGAAREIAASSLMKTLSLLSPDARGRVLADLEDQLGLGPPESPPPRFEPLTWDQARALERRGVTFGPHTRTHPDLARLGRREALAEISGSWNRLVTELIRPEPVFCYPYGKAENLSAEVAGLPLEAGLEGAVTAVQTYASAEGLVSDPFRIPRFGWPDTFSELRNITAGMSRAKSLLMRE